MPRYLLLPLTTVILVAMAIAMLASSVLLPMPDAAEVSVLGGTEVVQRFYAAVNETIATGNPAALQRVVTPSFVEENPLPGVDPGRAGLEDYLVALHDSVPGLRLVADVIVTSADQVVTRVQVRHEPTSATLHAAFGERRAVWSPIEVFRVADGVVVGRWGHTDGLTLARPLAEETLELPIPTPRVISLVRVALAPGARWDAPRVGPRLLFLEEGALDVQAVPGSTGEGTLDVGSHTIASDGGRADATQRVMLAAGKTFLAPAGAHMSTTNVGGAATQLLVVTFSEPQIPNGAAPEAESLPFGVEVQILAGDLATRLGSGSVTVALEQITLAPDAGLNLSSAEGPILVAVETGQLEAAVWGTAWVRRGSDGMSTAVDEATIAEGDGLLLHPGALIHVRNAGDKPAAVLILMLRPVPASTHVVADGEDVRHGSLHSTPLRPPSIGFSPSSEQFRGEVRHPAPAVLAAPINLRQDLAAMAAQQHRSHPAFLGSCPCPTHTPILHKFARSK